MKPNTLLKIVGLLATLMGLTESALASPKLIDAMPSTATRYSLFSLVTNKFVAGDSNGSVTAALQAELNLKTPKLTACIIRGDLNISAINCGNGAIQFGSSDFYSYNGITSLPPITLTNALDRKIRKGVASNFIVGSVVPFFQGDPTGRIVNIHFNQRVAQFGMLLDAGQALAPAVTGIQFIVNHQATPIKAVTGGIINSIGVEDSAGFTDLTIIASGSTRAWVCDQFGFVPLSAF